MDARSAALAVVRRALGEKSEFRDGQWEAIAETLRPGKRILIVQRTGWGKSVVYFVSTRLLRSKGKGPTLLVSPLLSLMRNQILLAKKFGVRAATINSTNVSEWERLSSQIERDEIDCLIISPERFGNEGFRDRVLLHLEKRLGLLVIDEAHCISDWGHDFRPDYRRILMTAKNIDLDVPILCTTATANDRVIKDINEQLGDNLTILRGPLVRDSLHLRVLSLADQAERLALLARIIPQLHGSGIVYTLTVADANRTASWLQTRGIAAAAYHGDLYSDRRLELEAEFNQNKRKCLVATTALGMGYDKPDVGFIIHYQRPGSIISYYQQIGRAGRSINRADIVLLEGAEDDEINNYFIETAFPSRDCFAGVIAKLKRAPASTVDLRMWMNFRDADIHKALALLEVARVVELKGKQWKLTGADWEYGKLRADEIGMTRKQEAEQMRDYAHSKDCRMLYLARALDDRYLSSSCGKCDRCVELGRPLISRKEVQDAIAFIGRDVHPIRSPKMFPPGVHTTGRKKIEPDLLHLDGVALCAYGDSGWGKLVREGKYGLGGFSEALIAPSLAAIRSTEFEPGWVTWVPSKGRADLVSAFAKKLALALGVDAVESVDKIKSNSQQKSMQNSSTQCRNVWDSFEARKTYRTPCLLVDDIVDSGWTLCAIAVKLRQSGSGPVMPFALATARRRGDA